MARVEVAPLSLTGWSTGHAGKRSIPPASSPRQPLPICASARLIVTRQHDRRQQSARPAATRRLRKAWQKDRRQFGCEL